MQVVIYISPQQKRGHGLQSSFAYITQLLPGLHYCTFVLDWHSLEKVYIKAHKGSAN